MSVIPTYYYLPDSGGSVTGPHIKEAAFFVEQGGLREEWGIHWKPLFCQSDPVIARQAAREAERARGSARYPQSSDRMAADAIKGGGWW